MINNLKVVNIYIIIGEANMRKSSVIRCLTGVCKESTHEIEHLNGKIRKTFIKVSSLQESDLTEFDFVNKVTNKVKSNYQDILISLRVNGLFNRNSKRFLNPAKDYINYFTQIGWNIIEIVYLYDINKNSSLGNVKPTLTLQITKNQPSNAMASSIRNKFSWK